MNDSENQKYCGTHGCPLDNDMCCDKCKIDWSKKYGFDKKKEELTTEEYEKWKNSYWLGKELLEGILKGKHDDYEKHQKTGPINNKKWFQDYNKENDNLTQKYFCDNCMIVQFHHLRYCPKCGGKFISRKMKYKEFYEKYGDYRAGY